MDDNGKILYEIWKDSPNSNKWIRVRSWREKPKFDPPSDHYISPR